MELLWSLEGSFCSSGGLPYNNRGSPWSYAYFFCGMEQKRKSKLNWDVNIKVHMHEIFIVCFQLLFTAFSN
jgi:hypothetical protein